MSLEFWGPERSYASRRCSPNRYLSLLRFFTTYAPPHRLFSESDESAKEVDRTHAHKSCIKNDSSIKVHTTGYLKEKERKRRNNKTETNDHAIKQTRPILFPFTTRSSPAGHLQRLSWPAYGIGAFLCYGYRHSEIAQSDFRSSVS